MNSQYFEPPNCSRRREEAEGRAIRMHQSRLGGCNTKPSFLPKNSLGSASVSPGSSFDTHAIKDTGKGGQKGQMEADTGIEAGHKTTLEIQSCVARPVVHRKFLIFNDGCTRSHPVADRGESATPTPYRRSTATIQFNFWGARLPRALFGAPRTEHLRCEKSLNDGLNLSARVNREDAARYIQEGAFLNCIVPARSALAGSTGPNPGSPAALMPGLSFS